MHPMPGREHAPSYYAATANDHTRRPALQGDLTADVCVIGAGFSGLSTALFLAERGAKVVVLEANRVGWGASGRNGGQLIGGFQGNERLVRQLGEPASELVARLWYRGHDIIEERIRKYAIACDLASGFLEAAARPSHMKGLEAYVEAMGRRGHGKHFRMLDKAEVSRLIGTDVFAGGYHDSRSSHLHPLNLCLGEARAFEGLGGRLFEGTEVLDIRRGAKPVVVTASGRVTADQVVLSGNAYHHLERKALGGLLFPAGTYVVATEPLAEDVARRINPRNLAVSDSNVALDYFRLSADRRLLFGGLCHYANRDPRSIAGALRPRMARVYPELARLRIDYEWGGLIGIVLTRVPLIGRLEPNIYFLQGYSGHGVNVAHIASEIVVNAMEGRGADLDLFGRMRQIRMPATQWIGNQLLALGMAYYKVKDRL